MHIMVCQVSSILIQVRRLAHVNDSFLAKQCAVLTTLLKFILTSFLKTVKASFLSVRIKVVHSLLAKGTVGVRAHCILGTANERWSPSLPYPSLIRKKYPFTASLTKKYFLVVELRSKDLNSGLTGDFLHHNQAALTREGENFTYINFNFFDSFELAHTKVGKKSFRN